MRADSVDPAERDAALTMCMISGSPDQPGAVTPNILNAVFHDHCYTKRPIFPLLTSPSLHLPQVTVKLNTSRKKSSG